MSENEETLEMTLMPHVQEENDGTFTSIILINGFDEQHQAKQMAGIMVGILKEKLNADPKSPFNFVNPETRQ